MNQDRAKELVSNFDKQVLVVGDIMLDKFIWGDVKRFSPEAPSCPVFDYSHEERMLGGAGNVASNLDALGAKCVRLTGIVGYDAEGREVRHMLRQGNNIDDQLQWSGRPTTVKIRFVSQDDRHLLRYDREVIDPLRDVNQKILLAKVRELVRVVSGVVIEDYGKGVLGGETIARIISMAEERGIPVFVDPKTDHWEYFNGVEMVKPNLVEAYAALGKNSSGCPECSLEDVGESLLKYTRAKAVVITRGEDGMSVFDSEDEGTGIAWAEPLPVDVVDVSGAGDTTMATLTLARLAGASWLEAMDLANAAAGVVVGKRGTATVTAAELLSRFEGDENA
jgi:D-beta-D-heptose 7-phosphate kinase/D-beta-D-heptose 1-phosphate adenosyltransferase